MKNKTITLLSVLIGAIIVFSSGANAQTAVDQDGKKNVAIEQPMGDTKTTKPTEIVDFSGEGTDEIFPNNTGWKFFGPTRRITVNGSQRIIGSGSAVLGTNSGTTQIAISICYQKDGDAVAAFAGNSHLIADADSLRRTFAVSVSGTLTAGTYLVGYCVVNRGQQTLGNNDYVNGWVMVVN